MKPITIVAALFFTLTGPFDVSPALAGDIATVYPDPDMSRAMEAAGGLTTLMAVCPDYPMPAGQRERMRILEQALRENPVYVDFFDEGVAKMTAEAQRNPNVCRDQLGELQDY